VARSDSGTGKEKTGQAAIWQPQDGLFISVGDRTQLPRPSRASARERRRAVPAETTCTARTADTVCGTRDYTHSWCSSNRELSQLCILLTLTKSTTDYHHHHHHGLFPPLAEQPVPSVFFLDFFRKRIFGEMGHKPLCVGSVLFISSTASTLLVG